ncbi:restriction endonuclease subunit S, partial [Anaerovibrio sp. JC8]|uniref:restriction endonuclease subunit S n=1 Tax=Anaerovibrio sp. JC8 TaxID=1240085 RepID=UPI001E348138
AQAFAIYKDFTCDHEASTNLSDIAVITMGTSPEGESFNTDGVGDIFYQGKTDFGFRFPTIRLYTTEGKRYAKAGDVLMSVRAPVGDVNLAKEDCAIGRGLASIRPKDGCYSFLYYTMQELNFELKKFNDEGTVFGSITKDDLYGLKIVPLCSQMRKKFEALVTPIDAVIRNNEFEIFQLQDICSTMLCRLTR